MLRWLVKQEALAAILQLRLADSVRVCHPCGWVPGSGKP